jgi:putative membrane protein insertion efficiency factor
MWVRFSLKWSLKSLITFYRLGISPFLKPRCRFLPTCSQYALDALERYGPYRGSILAFKRLCRCHPWGGQGHDPVKEDEL